MVKKRGRRVKETAWQLTIGKRQKEMIDMRQKIRLAFQTRGRIISHRTNKW